MENSGEEDSVKAARLGASSNDVPRSELPVEIPEESGRSKCKRVQKFADALNGCLCGSVLDGSLGGVLKWKQVGCETQWVSHGTSGHGN